MESRYFFVVGDKFCDFAKGKDVITVQQLKALVSLPDGLLGKQHVLMLGQGVQEDEMRAILEGCDASTAPQAFQINDLYKIHDRAPISISHKAVPHNTLIGTPQRKTADEYEIPLNIDERCELMGDHQTGQHTQGMILVEAFRQCFLAVTEAFFPLCEEKTYFVINEMNTSFQSFIFPLPAHICYRILESDVNPRRARYRTAMSAWQNGSQCATADISFTVYPASTIAAKEAELAHVVTRAMLTAGREQIHPTDDQVPSRLNA